MARSLSLPRRIKRKRQRNQGSSLTMTQRVVTGMVGFAWPFVVASGVRNAAKSPSDTAPMEPFTWSQLLLQGLATWGTNRLVDMTSASEEGKNTLAAGMYLSMSVTGLGMLTKQASPAVRGFLGIGGRHIATGAPTSSPSAPPKLETPTDTQKTRIAKLIYDPIAGRVAGFYSDTGYIPISETYTATDKDSGRLYFVSNDKEPITRPENRGLWIAKPQGSELPSVDTSGVDFSENSDEVGYRVRLVAGPSPEAGYLVDITRSVKMTYRKDEDLGAVFVKEPSDGKEYVAMSQTGHPLGIDESGKVISLTAAQSPVLGYGIPTSPLFAPNRFLLGGCRG